MALAILGLMLSCATPRLGLSLPAPKIDPCAVYPEGAALMCHAVPLNQAGAKDYDRPVAPMDICVTPAEYTEAEKGWKEMERLLKACP